MDFGVDPQYARTKRSERREKYALSNAQHENENTNDTETAKTNEIETSKTNETEIQPNKDNKVVGTNSHSASTQTSLPYNIIAMHAALAGKQRNLMLIEQTLHAMHRKKEEELEASSAYQNKLELQHAQLQHEMDQVEEKKSELTRRDSMLNEKWTEVEQYQLDLERKATDLEETRKSLEEATQQVQQSWQELRDEKEKNKGVFLKETSEKSRSAHPLESAVSYLEQARLVANFEGLTRRSNVLSMCLHALDGLIHGRRQHEFRSEAQSMSSASTRVSKQSRSQRRRPKFSLGSWKQT